MANLAICSIREKFASGGKVSAILKIKWSPLLISSNNLFEDFYIAIPSSAAQPVAIADEHGLISEITEYPISVGAIANFTVYKYKWPIKLTGGYLHIFTLIYL